MLPDRPGGHNVRATAGQSGGTRASRYQEPSSPPKFLHPFAQFNVRPAPCHIGGYRHRSLLPGLGNNLSFPFMKFCIEHSMANICPLEHPTKHL